MSDFIAMEIGFKNNSLVLKNFNSEQSREIEHITSIVREDITAWSSNVRKIPIYDNKTIINLFQWRGMSTWWIGRLVHKNSFDNNRWLNQLMILYICKNFINHNTIKIVTDDSILAEAVKANRDKINVNLIVIKNQRWLFELCLKRLYESLKIFFSILREIQTLVLMIFVKSDILEKNDKENIVWFRTLFPINWIDKDSDHDRLYGDAPDEDISFGFKSMYMVFVVQSKKDLSHGVLSLFKRVKTLKKNSSRGIFFPQKLINFSDIINVYWTTYKEKLFFKKLTTNTKFRELFALNDMDVSKILLKEWSSVYLGMQQYSKLQAIATSKFLFNLKDGQKIITYGEFFSPNRATYFLTKEIKPNTKFISIQHATNAKNKMFTYFRSNEFDFNNCSYGKDYSPYPDYFLAQGNQYKKILTEFYEEKRIDVIGTLKKININSKSNNISLNKIRGLNNKIMLLAPSSSSDYKIIFSFLSNYPNLNDWKIILSAHPTTNIEDIINFQRVNFNQMNIHYIRDSSTYELLSLSDVVILSASSIAMEAALFRVKAIRLYKLGTVPQFDLDDRIPSFCDVDQFHLWLKSQNFDKDKYVENGIYHDYFHSNDGQAKTRLWQFICNLDKD
jgi:hypothetical protein